MFRFGIKDSTELRRRSHGNGWVENGVRLGVLNSAKILNGSVWTKCPVKFFSRSKICPVLCEWSLSLDRWVNRAIFVWPWNKDARTKQKQQTNGNTAIWLVYRTDTNAPGFWMVKQTSCSKNFLEINWYFALTSYYNTTGQSNNSFSILGFSLAGKRRGHILIFSSIGW